MQNRIKEIRKNDPQGKNQQSFADYLGISMSNLASYESGRRVPSDAVISLICSKCGVNEEWLRTGKGEPYKPQTKNQQIAEWVNRVMADKDESFRKRFIHALSNMSDAGWDMLEKFLDDLNEGRE